MKLTGEIGERIAYEFLVDNGYKILSKNYRRKYGEIDIIGRTRDGIIVFFEVKTICVHNYGDMLGKILPEDNMTHQKIRKLRRICQAFTNQNETLIDERRGYRIDLVAITIQGEMHDRLTQFDKNVTINHYEGVC